MNCHQPLVDFLACDNQKNDDYSFFFLHMGVVFANKSITNASTKKITKPSQLNSLPSTKVITRTISTPTTALIDAFSNLERQVGNSFTSKIIKLKLSVFRKY